MHNKIQKFSFTIHYHFKLPGYLSSYLCPVRNLLFQDFLYSAVTSIVNVHVVIFATYSSQCAVFFEKCWQRCIRAAQQRLTNACKCVLNWDQNFSWKPFLVMRDGCLLYEDCIQIQIWWAAAISRKTLLEESVLQSANKKKCHSI